jgi:putative ABC transport system permease protein
MLWLLLTAVVLLALALVLRGRQLVGPKGRQCVASALRNLVLHKLRSFLSVLGIIIGTAAVIVLTAFGEGSMRDALEDIKRLGATNIILQSVKPPDKSGATQPQARIARYGLTQEDEHRFEETLQPAVIGTLSTRVFDTEVRALIEAGVYQGRVVATEPRYADLHHLDDLVAGGRFITEQDERQIANVAVLGRDVAAELFPLGEPLGKKIKIKDCAFEVVGILKDRVPIAGGERFNSDIYIPLRTWRERLGQRVVVLRTADTLSAEDVQLSQIILTVSNTAKVRPTADMVRSQLQRFHENTDYEVRVPLDRLEESERTRDRYRLLLFFIAGISLLVGGIGIMNIMLATVTERTREIGIRRALGASRSDITLQFIIEAVVQTALGGLIGVALGFALTYAIPQIYLFWQERVLSLPAAQVQHLPVQIQLTSVVLAFLVAVGVGVLFGWYPARRAARLDPIEALRHE